LLAGEPLTFANVAGAAAEPTAVMSYVASQFDPSVTWDDVGEIAQAWDGAFLLKGVTSAGDARRAADVGVDAVVVSNHGGRQLDHAPATIDVLPDVVEAVGGDLEVLVDSGFRRGSDIVKALALGASAVLVGRPYLYGLGTAGQAGVEHAVAILVSEMRRTMQLMGVTRVGDLDRTALRGL
jgi:L-lactate dehydrogenase (cytochrome)